VWAALARGPSPAFAMSTLAVETKPVALELHHLVKDLDPSRWRASLEETTRRRIAELEAKLRSMVDRVRSDEPLAVQLVELRSLLRDRLPAPDLPNTEVETAWDRYRKQLQAAYEELRGHLRQSKIHVPTLRPTNYARSLAHASIGVFLVYIVEEVLTARQRWLVPLCFATSFWLMEAARHYTDTGRRFLLWLFGPIAHPHERYRVNSSTWFGSALVIIGALYAPLHCALALAILGVADPAAGLIGRRFGKTKLVAERSLEGTFAFVVAGVMASLIVMAIWHGNLGMGHRFAIAFGAALFGGVAELFSNRVDDNLSIPVSAATGSFLVATLLGV
jgi:dolichol kinase